MKEQKTSTKRNLFLSDLNQSKLQREVEKVMKELTKALIDPLEEARKRLERAQQALNQQMARMQAELTKQTADPHYQIPLGVYLDYGNAKTEYAIEEKERLSAPVPSSVPRYSSAIREICCLSSTFAAVRSRRS